MPKKNIKDLIKKKQTKKDEGQSESAKKEEEDPVNPTSSQTQADQTKKDNESPIAKAQQNYDSDDSLDDADIQTDSKLYGMITENKDDKEEQTKIEGYGLEDKTQKSETKVQENVPKKEKKNANNINFVRGGPLKFSRGPKNNKMAGDFDVGLDDIDDSGNIKKEKKPDKSNLSGANGGYEFRNLGATAQARGPKKDEEEKSKDSAPLQRPRFTGKLNLTKTGDGGDQQQNTGVTTNYGFNVKYKQENPDGKKEKKNEDGTQEATGESQPEMRKDRRHIDRGANKKQGQDFNSTADDDKDEGFEVVQDKDKQRRQQRRQKKYTNEESNSDEDDGFTVTKPNRGTQNRGGAFANMN